MSYAKTKTSRGTRTSTEAAASHTQPNADHGESRRSAIESASAGTASARARPAPRLRVSDLELAARWGATDLAQFSSIPAGGRITRRVAHALRGDAPLLAVDALMGLGSESGSAAHVAAEDEIEGRDGTLPPALEESGVILPGESFWEVAPNEEERLGRSETSVGEEGWAVATGTYAGSPSLIHAPVPIPVSPRFFPDWFDICDDADQFRPIPAGWLVNKAGSPQLPEIDLDDSSLLCTS